MKESELEQKVVRFCRQKGLLTYKFTSPSSRGVPDRVIIGNSRVLWLELKQKGKKPTKLQNYELKRLRDAGVPAQYVDTFDKAKELINIHFTCEIVA